MIQKSNKMLDEQKSDNLYIVPSGKTDVTVGLYNK